MVWNFRDSSNLAGLAAEYRAYMEAAQQQGIPDAASHYGNRIEAMMKEGKETAETSLGTHQGASDTAAEYQRYMEEAGRRGIPEAESYYRDKIEQLRDQSAEKTSSAKLSFGSNYSRMSKSELQTELRSQQRKAEEHIKAASRLSYENATGGVYTPKNLIGDHIHSAKAAEGRVKEIKSELSRR